MTLTALIECLIALLASYTPSSYPYMLYIHHIHQLSHPSHMSHLCLICHHHQILTSDVMDFHIIMSQYTISLSVLTLMPSQASKSVNSTGFICEKHV